jgi:hypothetical protein
MFYLASAGPSVLLISSVYNSGKRIPVALMEAFEVVYAPATLVYSASPIYQSYVEW